MIYDDKLFFHDKNIKIAIKISPATFTLIDKIIKFPVCYDFLDVMYVYKYLM